MRCPECASLDDKVIETRVSKEGHSIRRRRVCDQCGYRFTTRETLVNSEFLVVKRDGRREDFDAGKLREGIRHACWKRSVGEEQLDELVALIIKKLNKLCQSEVQSLQIGEIVMEELQKIDEVAYVRFASIYRRFKDIDHFIDQIQKL